MPIYILPISQILLLPLQRETRPESYLKARTTQGNNKYIIIYYHCCPVKISGF